MTLKLFRVFLSLSLSLSISPARHHIHSCWDLQWCPVFSLHWHQWSRSEDSWRSHDVHTESVCSCRVSSLARASPPLSLVWEGRRWNLRRGWVTQRVACQAGRSQWIFKANSYIYHSAVRWSRASDFLGLCCSWSCLRWSVWPGVGWPSR